MESNKKDIGKIGEEIAVNFLKENGYEILIRNYRFGKSGEIDIIIKDPWKNQLVFVEVKTRANLEFGEPEYGVTSSKIKQIRKLASAYFYEKEIAECDCRFDVIAVSLQGKLPPKINHIVNAF